MPSDEVGHAPLRAARAAAAGPAEHAHLLFDGGCVTYEFAFDGGATASLMFDADSALAFQPRSALVAEVGDRTELSLCGAGAPPCPAEDRVIVAVVASSDVLLRVVLAVLVLAVVTTSSRCACSASGAAGARAARRRHRLGHRRRSWRSSLVDWDWGADGLVLHTRRDRHPGDDGRRGHARPARPARARWRSASGPVSSSRPARCGPCSAGSTVLRRYRELVRLARREGFGPFLSAAGRAERSTRPGVRLRRVLEEAGGVYVKLGQIAATRVDLVPPEMCDELAALQNRVRARAGRARSGRCSKPSSAAASSEVFAEFDWEPLAAASIGQTYRARLRTGEPSS